MYNPRHFAAPDEDAAWELAARLGVGHLVAIGATGLDATFLPLLVRADAHGTRSLAGHVARANPHATDLPDGIEVLVILTGADGYVSPSFYPSKAEHGRVVPTWNYTVVHARGTLLIHDDPAWVGQLVRDLTDHHEEDRPDRWSVDDAPAEFIAAQLRAIVGIEVSVTSIEAKRKMSQNRSEPDRAGVIAGLSSGTLADRSLAESMRQLWS